MNAGGQSLLAAAIARPLLASLLLLVAVIAAMEAGRWLGRNAEDSAGSGAVNGAVFAILGLILAFSFSGAASRFDARRAIIVQEANDIGTARLRVDLVPADLQPALHAEFDRYIAARIAAYRVIADEARFVRALHDANAISARIWTLAVAAGRRPDALPSANMLLLPALNAMIDVTATRAFMSLMHPPPIIRYLLVALALVAALLAGHGFARERRRTMLHEGAFAVIMTAIIFVTIDLEYPYLGFIRVGDFENAVIAFHLAPPAAQGLP